MTDKEPLEIAFDELAAVIKAKDESRLTFPEYIELLRTKAAEAQRQLEIAEAARDLCSETKGRRPRSDRGRSRKKPNQPSTENNPRTEQSSPPMEDPGL